MSVTGPEPDPALSLLVADVPKLDVLAQRAGLRRKRKASSGWLTIAAHFFAAAHNGRVVTMSLSRALHPDWSALPRRLRRLRKRGRWALRKLSAAPPVVRIVVIVATVFAAFFVTNLTYQVTRKPTEMFFLAAAAKKVPAETWRHYAPVFREYSTEAITPELLARLAQVEGAGDPLARTYWRWRVTWNPFRLYTPASSSVGMYQITDAAFSGARRYCIRDHTVVEDSCWFNGLYTRLVPSHAVELAAIYLDRHLTAILSLRRNGSANPAQKQDLAAVIYLCGAGPAEAFARRGFKLTPGEHCGDQDVATYLAHVKAMKREFLRFAADL